MTMGEGNGRRSLKPIPRGKRVFKGIDVFLLWAGGNTCLATIFTGGIIGPKLANTLFNSYNIDWINYRRVLTRFSCITR